MWGEFSPNVAWNLTARNAPPLSLWRFPRLCTQHARCRCRVRTLSLFSPLTFPPLRVVTSVSHLLVQSENENLEKSSLSSAGARAILEQELGDDPRDGESWFSVRRRASVCGDVLDTSRRSSEPRRAGTAAGCARKVFALHAEVAWLERAVRSDTRRRRGSTLPSRNVRCSCLN